MQSSHPSRSAERRNALATFPPVEQLLAHRAPMLLIDSILEQLDDGLVCKTVIGKEFLFLRDGEAEPAVCMELVAQAVGCFAGLADVQEGVSPRKGLLVGCRDARFFIDKLCLGDELLVKVRRQWIREPAASFLGEVVRAGEIVATVEIAVVSGIDPKALIDGGGDV